MTVRRVLPLLLPPERRDVDVAPGAPHHLVAAGVDGVRAEAAATVPDECVGAVRLVHTEVGVETAGQGVPRHLPIPPGLQTLDVGLRAREANASVVSRAFRWATWATWSATMEQPMQAWRRPRIRHSQHRRASARSSDASRPRRRLATSRAWWRSTPTTPGPPCRPAVRVPGRRRHRPVPRRSGAPARRQPQARAHRGQRTARVRLLPARCARGDRPRVRPDGPHLAPRPDLGDHLVWRPCRDGPVRPAARAPRLGRHRMAIGLTGEPVPPTIRSGAATNRNSHRSAASQSGTRSSNCR
jgi:hypothetical protein